MPVFEKTVHDVMTGEIPPPLNRFILARLTPMIISGSQHPLKIYYNLLNLLLYNSGWIKYFLLLTCFWICFDSNGVEFEYHKVSKQLEIKRNEVARMTKEFETKMKAKEVRKWIAYLHWLRIIVWLVNMATGEGIQTSAATRRRGIFIKVSLT